VLRLQLTQAKAEAAALQQELVRAGAAAAAAGPAAAAAAGPAEGVLQLPAALRELGQWKQRAQEAEQLLDEVRDDVVMLLLMLSHVCL
jgi:hypothetical protein